MIRERHDEPTVRGATDGIADGLFVGSIEAAGDEALLSDRGVETVVSLTHERPDGGVPPGVEAVAVPMRDGPRNERAAFERAVAAVRSRIDAGKTVLVHCSAGASRSPSVAATALALAEGVDLETAFDRTLDRRPAADPHPALVRQAARVYAALRE